LQANELAAGLLNRSNAGRDPCAQPAGTAIRVTYCPCASDVPLPAGLLAAVRFGTSDLAEGDDHSLCVRVRLAPLLASPPVEMWWATGPVEQGRFGSIRYARDSQHLFGVIELDEREHGGLAGAAATAYAAIRSFQLGSGHPHLLRVWNYFDAINEGSGDVERYRQFCVGRGRGLGDTCAGSYPAATAIGHQHTTHQLQVFWLASRVPGIAVENPRQISAYQYPRMHGPVSPRFARATLANDGTLLVSGTASIVGHSSQHGNDALAQLDETFRNLSTLLAHAGMASALESGARSLFKVYVRNALHAQTIAQRLRVQLAETFRHSNMVLLAADICRRELLLEIECLQLTVA
jgi:chorismate lyase/3-hydroxybenzoate synthase